MKHKNTFSDNCLQGIIELSQSMKSTEFGNYVESYLSKRPNRKMAIEELDKKVAQFLNLNLSLACFLKQKYLFTDHNSIKNDTLNLTKQEVAAKYRVSVRTINNWIASGLRTIEIGGVLRISEEALTDFAKNNTTKKFAWKSRNQH
jgi:hypothetical protein